MFPGSLASEPARSLLHRLACHFTLFWFPSFLPFFFLLFFFFLHIFFSHSFSSFYYCHQSPFPSSHQVPVFPFDETSCVLSPFLSSPPRPLSPARFPLDDGTIAEVNFTADENGYIAESPIIPAMPAHAIEQIRFAEELRRQGATWDQQGRRLTR